MVNISVIYINEYYVSAGTLALPSARQPQVLTITGTYFLS